MMKLLLTAFFAFFFVEGKSQVDSIIRVKLEEIRSIPTNYYTQFRPELKPRFLDSGFNYIIDLDTLAIPVLVKHINDTSLTEIENPINHSYFKQGDIALILLNYIEEIPYYRVTGIQYCVCCELGTLPKGFLEDVGKDRPKFVVQYLSYFESTQRQENLRAQRKAARKYKRREKGLQ